MAPLFNTAAFAQTMNLPEEFLIKMIALEKKVVRVTTWAQEILSLKKDFKEPCDLVTAMEKMRSMAGFERAWNCYFEDGTRISHQKRYGYTDPVYHAPKAEGMPKSDLKVTMGGKQMVDGAMTFSQYTNVKDVSDNQ